MDDDMIPEWLKLVEAGQLEMDCGEVEQYGRYRYLIDFWGGWTGYSVLPTWHFWLVG
jgi:hypothetical protein